MKSGCAESVSLKAVVLSRNFDTKRGTWPDEKSTPVWAGANCIKVGDVVMVEKIWREDESVKVFKSCDDCEYGVFAFKNKTTGKDVRRPSHKTPFCGVTHPSGCSAVFLMRDLSIED